MTPYRVIAEFMRAVDPREAIVTHDSGSPRDQLLPFYRAVPPRSYLGWGKSHALGTGLGLIIGAKLAAPDKFCVNFMGDAAFGMTGLDFETAVRCGVPILTVVLNNSSMAIEIPHLVVSHDKYGTRDIGGRYADLGAPWAAGASGWSGPRTSRAPSPGRERPPRAGRPRCSSSSPARRRVSRIAACCGRRPHTREAPHDPHRLLQRQVRARDRGADPLPRPQLQPRRRLLRHDAHLRRAHLPSGGARGAALPLAALPADRHWSRAQGDRRDQRRGHPAQRASPRRRGRLVARAAREPRRRRDRRRGVGAYRAAGHRRLHAAAPQGAGSAVPGWHRRRGALDPPHSAADAEPARQDPQLPEPHPGRQGSQGRAAAGVVGAARRERQPLRGDRQQYLRGARRADLHAAREVRAARDQPADGDGARRAAGSQRGGARPRRLRRGHRRRGLPDLNQPLHLPRPLGERPGDRRRPRAWSGQTKRITQAYVEHVGTDFVAQYLSRLA